MSAQADGRRLFEQQSGRPTGEQKPFAADREANDGAGAARFSACLQLQPANGRTMAAQTDEGC